MPARVKKPHVVITFPTTLAAMAFEDAAAKHGIPGRTIPVPSAISAGCGLSWCVPITARAELQQAIHLYGLEFEDEHIVDLY